MKWRTVCSLPDATKFGPLDGAFLEEPIVMGIDEYETVRLIDYEGMTQLECSEQLGVSRSTVQGIYDSARRKLARTLVEARPLLIEGGEYRLADHRGRGRCCGRGCRQRQRQGEQSL
ncbi:MAG TPA: DUF134 domain-containing protein [Sphaerochaeta sp.]|nr:DUF134 domain-containing protein [Sphaerochaeta sp.]HOQ95276.1 DUF134 domain-containing protein [Sphaerochaeta sp.]HPK47557.1 DUF134 domain-containing protein [Sphaerochaeta sp.]HPY11230.1 DUF134 domain-containing protein [Sphaerochaeta sp.]HQB89943.1 DUF134 domain-containing protein [Sphaerochaeta sp.]